MKYLVYDGSVSSHCCFTATVVDTEKPIYMGNKHYVDSEGRLSYESVCECFEMSDAVLICEALNNNIKEQ